MLGARSARYPNLPQAVAHPSTRPSRPTLIATAILAALIRSRWTAVSTPGPVFGATVMKTAICSANLRPHTTTASSVRASIGAGSRVTVVATVNGSAWRASCGGKTVSGITWLRISGVNGKSVRSLWGVTYLYAASGLFKAMVIPSTVKYAACGAYLRSSATSSSTAKMLLKTDMRVTVVGTVSGGAWKTTCAGNAVAGQTWHRISGVNGKSVKALFGTTYVYAASGLFKSSLTPASAPDADPEADPHACRDAQAHPRTDDTRPEPDRGDRRQPLAEHDRLECRLGGRQEVHLHQGVRVDDYVDPLYTTNRTRARTAGLLVGAYHFAQPSTGAGDAVAEADHYVDTATPASGDLLPVLDLERSGGLTQTALTAWVRAYLQRIYERTGVRAVIYCSPSFWKNYLGDTTWFAANGYKVLWVAHWTTASQPTVPGGAWGGNNWTFWQYTSDGSVPGISGRVDLNRYNGTDFTKVRIP